MEIHYGYSDGSGDYYIVIDTDRCDGCGDCVAACPENILEVAKDDYGDEVVRVRDDVISKVGYVCPGFNPGCSKREVNCRSACKYDVITHTW